MYTEQHFHSLREALHYLYNSYRPCVVDLLGLGIILWVVYKYTTLSGVARNLARGVLIARARPEILATPTHNFVHGQAVCQAKPHPLITRFYRKTLIWLRQTRS